MNPFGPLLKDMELHFHTCVIQTNQVIEQMEIVEPVWFQLKVKEF